MSNHVIKTLTHGWKFRRVVSVDGAKDTKAEEDWQDVSSVPSDIHSELIKNKAIPDPFIDLNELQAAWIADETWVYRTTFPTPQEYYHMRDLAVDLVLEGLDTFATVFFNGRTMLKSDNMFVSHRIDTRDYLAKNGEDNVLEIVFESARQKGLQRVKEHPEHSHIVHQTEVSRGPVRKAQYHWGWDWGPILLTCGPWKPVYLETYVCRIGDIRVDYRIDTTPTVHLSVHAEITGFAVASVEVELLFEENTILSSRDENNWDPRDGLTTWNYASAELELRSDPQLWWPRGYGSPNLYQVRVKTTADDGRVLAEKEQSIGFRKVELVQEADDNGKSFYFRVNGIDIFIGGSCWIPADSFLSQVPDQRYRDWISLLADGNQNMIRVWGGGVYESDAFYTACDELGILVWQDFMFACASYPTYPEFLQSVEREARQNLRRLRHHPSIVIWCGNNEDYQLIERYNLTYDFGDKDPESWLKTNFPARYIYEHLLPQIISSETALPKAIYHPGSPWGNGWTTTLKVEPNIGDIHQWSVWNGEARPWQCLPEMGGRFVSEFGMEAYPHLETIHKFVTDEKERYPGSKTIDSHNKAVSYERRLLAYLGENFRLSYDLEEFAYLTQVLQADTMSCAYKSWRRHWGSKGKRKCGGVLVWQLNDCWPTISWAVVDYYLVKKPAWYAIKRAMSEVAVGVSRKFHDWTARPADALWKRDTGHVDPTKGMREVEFDVWVSSSKLKSMRGGRVVVRFVSVSTGKDIKEKMEKDVDEILGNGCTETLAGCKFDWEAAETEPEPFVIHASLWVDGEQISSDTSWPDPLKYLDFSERGVKVDYTSEGMVKISADKPVKCFVISERQGVKISDNGFDLVPGEKPVQVCIQGSGNNDLSWTCI